MSVPDAWDECGGCGHDRDDHDGTRCDVYDLDTGSCDCPLFTDEAGA